MSMLRVLVAEDDLHLRKLITKFLEMHHFEVSEASNGQLAIQLFQEHHHDVVITDIMMPFLDGFSLVSQIRRLKADVPILILTALDSYQDKEKGFSRGVDDYMVKPIDFNELLLRIKALLRRFKITHEHMIELQGFCMNEQTMKVLLEEKPIELTRKEFALLFKLLSNPNQIFTREQLMDQIWGFDSQSYDRTVDTHIKRLRDAISSDSFEIITIRGLGYKAVLK